MALKCTNTSGPPASWVMKPKPFSPLNHFTVPVAIAKSFLSWPELDPGSAGHGLGSSELEGLPIGTGCAPSVASVTVEAQGLARVVRSSDARPYSALGGG